MSARGAVSSQTAGPVGSSEWRAQREGDRGAKEGAREESAERGKATSVERWWPVKVAATTNRAN